MHTPSAERPFLRLSECAEILGVSTSTCYRMAHSGRMPVIRRRPGGFFVPRAAFEEWLAAEAANALANLTLRPYVDSPNGAP